MPEDSGGGLGEEVLAGIIVAAICGVAGTCWAIFRRRAGCAPPRENQPMTNINAGGNVNVQMGSGNVGPVYPGVQRSNTGV